MLYFTLIGRLMARNHPTGRRTAGILTVSRRVVRESVFKKQAKGSRVPLEIQRIIGTLR